MSFSKATYSSIAFALSLLLSSCQLATLKNPEEVKVSFPPTVEEFGKSLHNNEKKTWRAQSFTLASLKGLQNCRLDDTMTISSDGTYEYDGGTELCGAEDAQRIKKGTWKILNNGTNLLFDEGTTSSFTAKVILLAGEKITLRGTYFSLEINGTYISN